MPIAPPLIIPPAITDKGYRLTINITDSSGVDESTVVASAFTVQNPDASVIASSIVKESIPNGVRVLLSFTPSIEGAYEILVEADQIKDVEGNAIAVESA